MLPVLQDLLQAMLVRMWTARMATFLQSLVVPFAFLVYSHHDAALDLLETTRIGEGEDSRSGLDVLLNTWCENAATFQGFWPTRVSTHALCTLLTSERPSLQAVVVMECGATVAVWQWKGLQSWLVRCRAIWSRTYVVFSPLWGLHGVGSSVLAGRLGTACW